MSFNVGFSEAWIHVESIQRLSVRLSDFPHTLTLRPQTDSPDWESPKETLTSNDSVTPLGL